MNKLGSIAAAFLLAHGAWADTPVILGAWLSPRATEAEFQAYENAGFNVIIASPTYAGRDWRGDESFDLAEQHHLKVILDLNGFILRDGLDIAGSRAKVAELIDRWGSRKSLIGFWIADDCENPGAKEAAIVAEIKARRPDLLAIICQDRPNGKAVRAVGASIEFDQVYSFKGPEREIDRLCRQSLENGLTPWVIVNIQFKDKTLDFRWTRSTLLYAKSKGVRAFWYLNLDPDLFDGAHDLAEIKHLNSILARSEPE